MGDETLAVAPVACNLDAGAYHQRAGRIQTLMARALLSRERLETSVILRFCASDTKVERELDELVGLERECCPFLTFSLEKFDSEIVLTIAGPAEAAALLDDAFRVTPAIQIPKNGLFAIAIGAIAATVCVASCCVLPVGLTLLGLGVATPLSKFGRWIDPYRTPITLCAMLAVAYGLHLAYRPQHAACAIESACRMSARMRLVKSTLWLTLVSLVAIAIVK